MGECGRNSFVVSVLVLVSALAVAVVGTPTVARAATSAVVIAEFMADNDGSLADSDGEASDWFELHNTSRTSVDLAGWVVSDSSNSWEFPAVTMPAGSRRIVWASGKNRTGTELHTNFKLSSEGEYFALVAPNGDTSAFAPEYPPQTEGTSYGTATDGSVGYLARPSPGSTNSALGPVPVAAPVASTGNSLQQARFVEQLESATNGATIRYTLNQSTPTRTSTVAQSGRVSITPVNQVTVLKAAAFLADGSMSPVTTVVYVNPAATAALYDRGNQAMINAITSLPVMTIRGSLRVPGAKESIDFQPVGFDLIDPDGPGFSVDAGGKVFGAWSLTKGTKRNYRLKFSSKFGPGKLKYPLFDDFAGPVYEPATEFDQLELRGPSLDYEHLVANEFARQTIMDLGTPSSHGRWVNLYVDGDFRGIYRLRERLNADWLDDYQGGSDDDYESVMRDYQLPNRSVNHGTGELIDAFDAATSYAAVREIIDPRAYVNAALAMWPFKALKDNEREWRFVGRQDPSHPLGAIMIPNDMDDTLRDRYFPGFTTGMAEMLETFAKDPEFKQIVLDQSAKAFCGDGPLTQASLTKRLDSYISQLRPAVYSEERRYPFSADGREYMHFRTSQWEQNMRYTRTHFVGGVDKAGVYESPGTEIAKQEWQAKGLFAGCNLAPTIDVPVTTMAAVGEPVSMPITATDDSGAAPTINVTGVPAGMTYRNGKIVGTPTRAGSFETKIVATDSNRRYSTHRLQWQILPASNAQTTVTMNEFNAVSASHPWAGSDTTLGRTKDNGGDWLELVVTEPTDLRGWSVELWDRGKTTGLLEKQDVITFSDNVALANVAAGTIVTVSEDQPDDPYRNPIEGDWHLNANSSSAMLSDLITPTSRANFDTNADGFRIVLRNAAGDRVGPVAGENDSDTAAVTDGQVWMRCSNPGVASQTYAASSTRSTFGEPNQCGSQQQSLAALRMIPGDVDCSSATNQQDVRAILELDVDLLKPLNGCGGVSAGQSINGRIGDVDANGKVGLLDALMIALCLADKPNALCPSS